MTRRTIAAWAMAALCMLAATGPTPMTAGAACGSYGSQTVPPSTVRVFRAASGRVDTVDFRAYLKNVLSREWISSWTTESLRAGALAVKHYAWYQVLHWRGYVSASGDCFDLFDTARDQVYDPARPIYAPMASAVDATWSTLALRNGSVFPTYYNSGTWNEPCGANANGWQMFQWGSQACGLAGRSAAQIMSVYYTGVQVTAAPPASTPPPTPTPGPSSPPTPPPPAGSPGPVQPPPAATPAPTPQASPPAPPDLPGGGQVGMAAPPPPPAPDPAPIVVTATRAPAVSAPRPSAAEVDVREMRDRVVVRFERAADEAAAGAAWRSPQASARFIAVRLWIGAAVEALLADLATAWKVPPARGRGEAMPTALAGVRRV